MPVAAQVTDDCQLVLPKQSVLVCFRKVEDKQWARPNLQPRTTVNTDGPGCFRMVAAA